MVDPSPEPAPPPLTSREAVLEIQGAYRHWGWGAGNEPSMAWLSDIIARVRQSDEGPQELLRAALLKAAEWFDEYAAIHDRKGDEPKKARNQTRADYLRNVANRAARVRPESGDGAPSERPVHMSAEELGNRLEYVAQTAHLVIHGIKDAPDWKVCKRQPCKVANRGFPAEPLVDVVGQHPAAAPAEREEPETVWLIERGQPEGQVPALWWAGESEQWTADANKAVKYSKETAERVITEHSRPGAPFGRATEHLFLGPQKPAPSQEPVARLFCPKCGKQWSVPLPDTVHFYECPRCDYADSEIDRVEGALAADAPQERND